MLVRKLCGRNILHIIYVWYEIWCRATQAGDLTRNVISWISWFGKCLSITSNLLCLSSLDMVGFEVYDIHCNVDKPSGLLAFFIFFIWVFIKKNCYYSCNGMNDSFCSVVASNCYISRILSNKEIIILIRLSKVINCGMIIDD